MNRFAQILADAARIRAERRTQRVMIEAMKAARAEAQRRARSDLMQVTAYRPAQTREAGAGGAIASEDVPT